MLSLQPSAFSLHIIEYDIYCERYQPIPVGIIQFVEKCTTQSEIYCEGLTKLSPEIQLLYSQEWNVAHRDDRDECPKQL